MIIISLLQEDKILSKTVYLQYGLDRIKIHNITSFYFLVYNRKKKKTIRGLFVHILSYNHKHSIKYIYNSNDQFIFTFNL